MKTNTSIIITLLLCAPISASYGESAYEREMTQLKAQRDKAAATALEPINRRYRESMEQLLRKATQGNDLDTALKIKTELGALGSPLAPSPPRPADAPVIVAPPPSGAAFTDLKLQLPGSKWNDVKYKVRVTFAPNGKLTKGSLTGTYEAKAHNIVTIQDENDKKPQQYNLSRDGRHLLNSKGIIALELESAK